MTTVKSALVCAVLASLCTLLVAATTAVCVIASVAQQLPKQLDAAVIETRGQVLGQIGDVEHDLLNELRKVEVIVQSVVQTTDSRLGKIEDGAHIELATTRELVTAQLGSALGKVDQALEEVHALRLDAQPILENASQITAHATEASAILFARNALPAQILGVLGATKVTMGEAALAMRVVKDSAPAIAASTIDTADSVRGVAADVHTVADNYLKPVGFWRKLWGGVKTAAILYVRTL